MTTALNSGLYAVTLEPAGDAASAGSSDLRFEYRDSAGVYAIKEFHFEPTSYIVAFRDVVTHGDKTLTPAIQWGPAVGDAVTEVNRFTVKAEGIYETGGKIRASRRRTSRSSRWSTTTSSTPASTTSIS